MTESKRKSVVILTAEAGFGHRSAARAIAEALREKHGPDCAVEIVNPMQDERVPAVLRNSGTDYDRMIRKVPKLYKFEYEISNAPMPIALVESALVVMLFEALRDVVRRHRPDAIISLYPLYQAPLGAIFTVSRQHIPLLTVVTDMAPVHRMWFSEAADLCLVASAAVRDQALEYGLSPEKVQVTGIPVRPEVLREHRAAPLIRAELGWQPDLKTVLAVGSKRVTKLWESLHALNHSGLPLQLAIVAGGDDDLYGRLQRTTWHVPAHVYNFVDNMPTLMHAADVLICKAGGLIVTEALAVGLPLLLVDVLPGQESGNADYVLRGGAGELAANSVDVLEILHHWLDKGGALLSERAANARRLGRPHAAYEVAERAWAAALRGPSPQTDSLFALLTS